MAFESLPDPTTLTLDEARSLRFSLLTKTRPAILRRLTMLRTAAADDLASQIDRVELEFRLAAIDVHDVELDAAITVHERPSLPHEMAIELHELILVASRRATARAGLFYSPEAKFNVHGPIMLFHVAALAELLLESGETIVALETVSFNRMVISHLRLTIVDATADELPPKDAAIIGAFRLSSGRRLIFHGVPDREHPVAKRCWINRLAAALAFGKVDLDDAVYRFHTPNAVPPELVPAGGLGMPSALMTVIDTLVMMMLSQHIHADETRLLLSIRELPISIAMLEELAIGTTIAFEPHTNRARRVGEMIVMPTDVRFGRFPDARTRIMTGESTVPYYRMPVG